MLFPSGRSALTILGVSACEETRARRMLVSCQVLLVNIRSISDMQAGSVENESLFKDQTWNGKLRSVSLCIARHLKRSALNNSGAPSHMGRFSFQQAVQHCHSFLFSSGDHCRTLRQSHQPAVAKPRT